MIVSFPRFTAITREAALLRKLRGMNTDEAEALVRVACVGTGAALTGQSRKPVIFGFREENGELDLRMISSQSIGRLSEDIRCGYLSQADEGTPNMSDIAKACSPDEYSIPCLFLTSADMSRSLVWIDDDDPMYLEDLAECLLIATHIFDDDMEESDKIKTEAAKRVATASVLAGKPVSRAGADAVLHHQAEELPAKRSGILDATQARRKIERWNRKVSVYKKIADDFRQI